MDKPARPFAAPLRLVAPSLRTARYCKTVETATEAFRKLEIDEATLLPVGKNEFQPLTLRRTHLGAVVIVGAHQAKRGV